MKESSILLKALVFFLYKETLCSWWCIEPFVVVFQRQGWFGLQRLLKRQDAEKKLSSFSSRWQEFPASRQANIAKGIERLSRSIKGVDQLMILQLWQEKGERFFSAFPWEEQYPRSLHRIDEPPPILWSSRKWEEGKKNKIPRLAVVGSRKSSLYGKRVTERLVRDLVEAYSATIVSGCAVGIDSVAHSEALKAKGRTIGVLGTGLGQVSGRVREMLSSPAAQLVTEFPPEVGGREWNFVRRNRLIAGLAEAVLVVEAQEQSGTLITSSAALEQGKEVFVIPHSIWSKNGAGITRLANAGARLVLSASELMQELGYIPVEHTSSAEHTLPNEQSSLLQILKEKGGEMPMAELLLERPGTISSSSWWQALSELTNQRVIQNTMGVVRIQNMLQS